MTTEKPYVTGQLSCIFCESTSLVVFESGAPTVKCPQCGTSENPAPAESEFPSNRCRSCGHPWENHARGTNECPKGPVKA